VILSASHGILDIPSCHNLSNALDLIEKCPGQPPLRFQACVSLVVLFLVVSYHAYGGSRIFRRQSGEEFMPADVRIRLPRRRGHYLFDAPWCPPNPARRRRRRRPNTTAGGVEPPGSGVPGDVQAHRSRVDQALTPVRPPAPARVGVSGYLHPHGSRFHQSRRLLFAMRDCRSPSCHRRRQCRRSTRRWRRNYVFP